MGGQNGEDKSLNVIDLGPFLGSGSSGEVTAEVRADCSRIADCLHSTGALVVRDPRVSMADNDRFVGTSQAKLNQNASSER